MSHTGQQGWQRNGPQEIRLFKLLALLFDLLRQFFRMGFGFGTSCAQALQFSTKCPLFWHQLEHIGDSHTVDL